MKNRLNVNAMPKVFHYDACSETMESAVSCEFHQESPELRKVVQEMAFGQMQTIKAFITAMERDAEIGHFVFDANGKPKALVEFLDEVEFVRNTTDDEVVVWARIGTRMEMSKAQFETLVESGHLPAGVKMTLDGDCYAPHECEENEHLPESFEDFSVSESITYIHA